MQVKNKRWNISLQFGDVAKQIHVVIKVTQQFHWWHRSGGLPHIADEFPLGHLVFHMYAIQVNAEQYEAITDNIN